MTIAQGRPTPFPVGDRSRPWPEIEAKFADLARENSAFEPLADLSHYLACSGFAKAGLSGATSMHDLVISSTAAVFDYPHLRIEYDFAAKTFRMTYFDGSPNPWQREAPPSEISDAVDRFLTRRVRWYRAG